MRPAVAIALLAAVPAVALAVFSVAHEVPRFFDPCFTYGDERMRQGSGEMTLAPDGPCARGMAGTSETRAGTVVRLILVQGVALAAAALGVVGAARGSAALMLTSAAWYLVVGVPLVFGGLVVVAFACSGAMLAAARTVPLGSDARVALHALGAVGVVALVWLLPTAFLAGMRWEVLPFVGLWAAAAALVAFAGLWPLSRAAAPGDEHPPAPP